MNDAHIDDLVDLYALAALAAAETERAALHAAGCARCAALLRTAEETAARLALAVPLRAAPAALRGRVLAEVATGGRGAGSVLPPPAPAAVAPATRGRRHLRFSRRLGALVAGLALLPLVGLVAWATLLQTQVNDLRADNRDMQETQRDVVLLATSPTVKGKLTPTEHATGAAGYVSWQPDEGRCAVLVKRLPPLDDAVYRVRYDTPAGQVVAGELKPDAEGTAELMISTERWHGNEYTIWIVAEGRGGEAPRLMLSGSLRRE